MKNLILMALTLSLVACGGGGGSGGGASNGGGTGGGGTTLSGCTDPLASNFNSSATSDDGSCVGRDGEASFYGFNRTTSTAISNNSTLPSDVDTNIIIPNEFYLQVGSGSEVNNSTNGNNRVISTAIHSPVCRIGADFRYYSAVSLGGTGATSISILVMESSITIAGHSIRLNNNTRYEQNLNTYTSSCYRGKVTITGVGELYENGDMVVFKSVNNDLYVGVNQNTNTTSMTFGFQAYNQHNYTGCNLSGCGSPTASPSSNTSINGNGTYMFNNGSVSSWLGNGTMYLYSNGVLSGGTGTFTSNTTHGVVEGSGHHFQTVSSLIGGLHLIIGSMPLVSDCSVALETYCTGSAGVLVGIED